MLCYSPFCMHNATTTQTFTGQQQYREYNLFIQIALFVANSLNNRDFTCVSNDSINMMTGSSNNNNTN